MSYDVDLKDETGNPVSVDSHEEGGTYMMGGNSRAELNITYNYSKYFYEHIDKEKGLRWLYGKKAKDCIAVLEKAVEKLGTTKDEDYWAVTPGNAGHSLSILLKWAKSNPDAVFNGD